ncbi:MAG: InlB B-repeat-containing protein [bacterium]
MKKIISLIMTIMIGASLVGCGSGESTNDNHGDETVTPNEEVSYTITFDTNGGSSVDSITLDSNDEINLPASTKAGYVFAGWYLESGLLTAYSSSVEKVDRTLYAKWELVGETNGTYEVELVTSIVMPEAGESYENGTIDQNDLDQYNTSYESFVDDINDLSINNWGGLCVKFINGVPYLEFAVSRSTVSFLTTANTTTSSVELTSYDEPLIVSGYLQGTSISSDNPTYNTAINPYRVELDSNYEVNLKLNGGNGNSVSGEHFGYLNVKINFKSVESEFIDVSNTDVLEDGIYKVDAKIAKAYSVDSASMADQFNSGYAYIEVLDGKMVMHKENAISQNYLTATDAALNEYASTATMALMNLRKFDMGAATYYEGITNDYVDFEMTYSNSNSKTFDGTMYSRYMSFTLDSIHDDYLMDVAVTGVMLSMNSGAQNMVLDINENTIVKVDSLPYALENQTFIGEELEFEMEYSYTFGTWDSNEKVYIEDFNALETNHKGNATDVIIAYSMDINSDTGFDVENLLDIRTIVETTITDTGVDFNTKVVIYLSDDITENGHYLNFVNMNAFTEYKTNGSTTIDVITTSFNINSVKNIALGDANQSFYDEAIEDGGFVMLCLSGLDPNNLSRLYSYFYTLKANGVQHFGYTNIYNPSYNVDMSKPTPNSPNPNYVAGDYVFEFTASVGESMLVTRGIAMSFSFTL